MCKSGIGLSLILESMDIRQVPSYADPDPDPTRTFRSLATVFLSHTRTSNSGSQSVDPKLSD
jgi:hypothetical protein